MNVLIGCECTGTIRDSFRKAGHNAYSCDILPDQKGSVYHIQDDILKVLESEAYRPKTALIIPHDYWDLFIVHPDCTYLTCAAEWAYKDRDQIKKKLSPDKLYGAERRAAREEALQFVRRVIQASKHIPKFCMENPGYNKINTIIARPDQFIQPHEYGHDASKKTGLWLRGLPKLTPTKKIEPRMVNGRPRWANQTDSGQNSLSPSKDRWLKRATTYQGWADAMVRQWGELK